MTRIDIIKNTYSPIRDEMNNTIDWIVEYQINSNVMHQVLPSIVSINSIKPRILSFDNGET